MRLRVPFEGRVKTLRPAQQCAQTDQVIDGRGERQDPIDQFAATVAQFAEQPDRFHPSERLLDQFPFPLTDHVARMPGRATIDGRVLGLLRDVRRDVQIATGRDKAGDVVVLVPADGPAAPLAATQQDQRGFTFGRPGRGGRAYIDDQSMAVFREQVAQIREGSVRRHR